MIMDYAFLIYIASAFGSVSVFLAILSIAALLVTGVGIVFMFAARVANEYPSTDPDDIKVFNKHFNTIRSWFATAFVVALISCFIPSERIIYMMVGASIVQDVVEDPRTAGIADRVVRLIEQKLDEELVVDEPAETSTPAPAEPV